MFIHTGLYLEIFNSESALERKWDSGDNKVFKELWLLQRKNTSVEKK